MALARDWLRRTRSVKDFGGEKDVENRSWRTSHRGLLLIHAGFGADREYFRQRSENPAAQAR